MDLNPALLASWQALAALYRATGQGQAEGVATAQAQTLAKLPPPVLSASGMFAEGDVFGAEAVLRSFLMSHGDHIEGMRLLAKIGLQLEVFDDAEFLLESVLVLAPDYHAARYDYSIVLNQRHKHARALEGPTGWSGSIPRIAPAQSLGPAPWLASAITRRQSGSIAASPSKHRRPLTCTCRSPMLSRPSDGRRRRLNRTGEPQRCGRPSATHTGASPTLKPPVHRSGDERHARASCVRHQPRRPLSPMLRARQGPRGSREYAESFHFYKRGNALEKAEARYDRHRSADGTA